MSYKIRDKNTGLFSTGGSQPQFRKTGKTYTSIQGVRSSLTTWLQNNVRGWYNYDWETLAGQLPNNWEVVHIPDPNPEYVSSAEDVYMCR